MLSYGAEGKKMSSGRTLQTRALAQSALFAALLCLLSPIAIPLGSIPVTLSVFVVMLTGVVLPWRQAGAAVLAYLLIGLVGLPVFSGGQAGIAVFLGPTGGYLWCYLPMVVVCSLLSGGAEVRIYRVVAGNLLALALCYATGTAQFMLIMDCSASYALRICVLPFLLLDAVKLFLAALLGVRIRNRLCNAGLL